MNAKLRIGACAQRAAVVLALLWTAAGCATSADPQQCEGGCQEPGSSAMGADAGGRGLGSLCDGSDTMRLGYTTETHRDADAPDGPSSFYGQSFFFIDGDCNYFASHGPQRGTVSGRLTRDEAAELEAAIGWSAMDELAQLVDVNDCGEAELEYLWAPELMVTPCECTCAATRLGTIKAQAFEAARDFLMRHTLPGPRAGAPLTTPLLAIASQPGAVFDGDPSWPLERALADVSGLVGESWHDRDVPMVMFSEPNEVELLRALRDPEVAQQYVRVQSEGDGYELFMRDALPEGVEAKIRALRARPDPFCLGDRLDRKGGGVFECGDGRVHRKLDRACATATDCARDSDCGEEGACLCDVLNGSSRCVRAQCRTDEDCGTAFCALAQHACGIDGFFCGSPDDLCVAGAWPCTFDLAQGHFVNGPSSCD